MATSLRDWAKQLGINVGYDKSGQVSVGDGLKFQSGQGSQYGIGFDGVGSHYVSDGDRLKQALGLGQSNTQSTPQAPAYQQPQFDFAQTINDLYERERQARLMALQNQLQGQTADLNRQRIALAPQFQQERVQTDTSAQMAGKRLAEVMANRGLDQGGENITANIGLQTARQQALSNIGQRETTANAEIDQRIADLQVAGRGDIAQMEAALSSDQTRAMLDHQYRDRDFGYQQYMDQLANYWRGSEFDYQKERDRVGDQRYDQQWNWQTDPTNPAYQRQMLELEMMQMNVANMPEQQRLELERLRQQIRAGNIDIATANEQLNRLKQGLPMNPSAGSGSSGSDSGGGINAQQWENSLYGDLDDFLDSGDIDGANAFLVENRDAIRSLLGQQKYAALLAYTQANSGR